MAQSLLELNRCITPCQWWKESDHDQNNKYNEYAKARVIAKDKKGFRQPGIDIRGPEKREDPFWTYMRRFYAYDPAPTLRASTAPLLAIFGELDTLRVSKRK